MISERLWANAVKDKISRRLSEPDVRPIVIDDLRFRSDWEVVSAFEGLIVRIRRPGSEPARSPLDVAYHRLGGGKVMRGKGLFGWKPLHETEFHWRDAPSCRDIPNNSSPSVAADALLAALSSEGRWPLDGLPASMTF